MPLPSVDEKTAVTASPGETTSRAQRLAALRLERQKGRAQSQKLDERAASARGRHPGLALIDEARRLKASMHEARRKLREAEWVDAGIKSVKLIGDANAPGPIAWATYAGHRYARELDGEDIGDALPFRREITQLAVD